jgi:peptidoglycan/LPS O-acetylase OafA/YrhL
LSVRTEQIEIYNPAFDYVRAIASLMVLFTHASIFVFFKDQAVINKYVVAGLETLGVLSVEFFFALSGILLGRVLYQQFESENVKSNIRVFLMRRWMRTFPVYYLGLAAFIIIYNIYEFQIPSNLPLYFIFLQSPISYNIEFYNVSWSLCIEEIFYILFPAMAWLLIWKMDLSSRKAFIYSAIILIVFCFLSRQLYLPLSKEWLFDIRMGTVFRLDSIAIGLLVGIIFQSVSRLLFILACLFIAGCGVTFIFLSGNFDPALITYQIVLQICFTGMPWACAFIIVFISRNYAFQGGKVLRFFADISYALYVIHMVILYILMMAGIQGLALKILFIPSSIAASYFIFKYIETPILKARPNYNYSTLAKTVA